MGKLSQIRKFAIVVCAVFLVCSIAAGTTAYFYPDIQATSWIQALSSSSIVLLTLFYVLITSHQLEIMALQIREMKQGRELLAQPLIQISLEEAELEKPRLYYAPPFDEYSLQSRLSVVFNLVNRGSHTAIGVDVSGYLYESSQSSDFEISSRYFETIAEKEDASKMPGHRDFFFVGTKSSKMLLSCLRSDDLRPTKRPVIAIEILFKNTYGACFQVRQAFQLRRVRDEDREVLSSWQSITSTFDTTFDRELKELRSLRVRSDEKWELKFDSLKESLSSATEGTNMKLSVSAVPKSFSMASISEEEYTEIIKTHGYGQAIPNWLRECIHIDPKT
jgi:hypothetical protein